MSGWTGYGTATPSGFQVAGGEEIRSGGTTDVYFPRMLRVLEREEVDPEVVMEVRAKRLPEGWPWAVLAGVEEVAELFAGRDEALVRALPEGSLFQAGEPVVSVEGRYRTFATLETALLGLLCQASGVATAAARCKRAAGDRAVLSFGARRMHPAITPMIARSAYLGGCDGVSAVGAADRLGIEPTGTMPHALVLILGDTVRAARAFAAAHPGVPTIVLIDTFADEVSESVRVADALGDTLEGIRFDTPGSRRGDLLGILEEARWELDRRGYADVAFYASGGIGPEEIVRLNPQCAGYGVGGAIAAAPPVDFSLDIVEIDGSGVAKRGKKSGRKALLLCDCGARTVVPAPVGVATWPCPGCGVDVADALRPPADPYPPVEELRGRVREFLERVELDRPLEESTR